MNKKILIFSLAYYPKHIGGAEVAIKEITDRINNIEFHMVTNRFDSTLLKVEQVGNIKVHRIGIVKNNPSMAELKKFPLHINKFIFQFLAALKAMQLYRKYHYDAIWAMMAHSTGVPAAIFKIFYPKTSFALTLQEGDPIEYIEKKMKPLWPFFARAFTKADIIQAISTFLGKWARARGFKGALEIIPNAVNTKHFSQEFSKQEIDSAKHDLGKKDDDVFIVTTSRLVEKNAIDDVIRAMKFLPDNVHFIVFGTGPDEEKLKKLAQKEKVESRVHFRGQIGHKEMPLYLKACDIFTRPSRSEGMGNSFIEAMAAGIPVIATPVGGIPDFLRDGETGLFCEVNNPKSIVEKVKLYLENNDLRERIIKNAQEMVVKKYDWDLIAKDMCEKVFGRLFKGI